MKALKNRYFLFNSVTIVLVSLSQVFFNFSIKYLIDALTLGDSRLFKKLFIFLILAVFVLLISEYTQQVFSKIYVLKQGEKLHYRKMLQVYEISSNPASLDDVSSIVNDIEQVKDLYIEPHLTLVQGISSLLLSLIALATLDLITAAFIFTLSCLPIIIPFLFEKKLTNLQEAISDKQAQHLKSFTDYVQGIRTIKNSLSGQIYKEKLIDRYRDISQAFINKQQWGSLGNVLIALSFYATTLIILLIGGWQVFKGRQTVGSILAIYAISSDLVHPISLIASALSDRKSSKTLLTKFPKQKGENLESIQDLENFEKLSVKNITVNNKNGEQITFPTFTIKKGEKLLLTGSNGSGKSTLLELLSMNRTYDSGNITLNTIDYSLLYQDSIQKIISYLPQNPYLFYDSVLNNLTLYRPYDEKVLLSLIQLVGLADRFPTLKSLNELITNKEQLSGGQIQKLALVRGLLQHRPLFLIDEGLNALDKESFERLENYLLSRDNLAVIHVSHQSSVDRYDKTISLD